MESASGCQEGCARAICAYIRLSACSSFSGESVVAKLSFRKSGGEDERGFTVREVRGLISLSVKRP